MIFECAYRHWAEYEQDKAGISYERRLWKVAFIEQCQFTR